MANKTLSDIFKRWVGGRRAPIDSSMNYRNRSRLRLEEVEQRLAPATLPTPTVSDTRIIGQNTSGQTFSTTAGDFAPQAVSDPNNPNTIVVVSGGPTPNNNIGAALNGQISRDGGQTWTQFGIANPDTSTNNGPGGTQLTNVNSPSVAFSRTGQLYVVWTSTTADFTTAGRLRVASFTVTDTNVTVLNPSVVLYEWQGQDPVFNPTVAVDTNVDNYTDPDTLNTTPIDTMLGYNNSAQATANVQNGTVTSITVDPANTGSGYTNSVTTPVFVLITPTGGGSGAVATADVVNGSIQNINVISGGSNYTTAPTVQVLQQTGGKAVYVAWNTGARAPTIVGHTTIPPASILFTPTAIFAAGSRDQGKSWTTPVTVSDGGFFVNPNFGGGMAPQIVFTPADLNPNTNDTSGHLQFYWSMPRFNANVAQGGLVKDDSQPDTVTSPSTQLTNQVATNYTVSTGQIAAPIFEPNIDPNGGPDQPVNSDIPLTVTINTAANSNNGAFFTTLQDIDVTIAAEHPHTNQLEIFLVPPATSGAGPIQLLESRILSDGNARPLAGNVPWGLPDQANIGVNPANGYQSGTVFDDQAARLIQDPANTAPYIAHFRPEVGSFNSLLGKTAAQLNGTWILRFVDMRDDDGKQGFTPNLPIPHVDFWSMKMTSLMKPGFGQDSTVPTGIHPPIGTSANLGGAGATNAAANGFGAGLTLAFDNSLGSFSPFSGFLYAAYVSNGNIFVISSDDDGKTWSSPVQVNDDSLLDNFTEGNRDQFQPSITVDPVTGMVVVMWYDDRWDASHARVATYVSTSIDGGATWSAQGLNGYLNASKTAVDQIGRTTVNLEPIPTNLRASGSEGGGVRQSVLAYNGQIKPFWTGNLNANSSDIYTATVQTAAGPRIISSDMGVVSEQSLDPAGQLINGAISIRDETGATPINGIPDALTANTTRTQYNDKFAADGTRLIDGFEVIFDRPIDVSTFTTADITVLYRAPGTQRDSSVPPTQIPLATVAGGAFRDGVIPISPVTIAQGTPDDATAFFVQFATPQSSVGTYSYSISPTISDRIRSRKLSVFTAAATPTVVTDLATTDSTINVPQQAGNPSVVALAAKPTAAAMQVTINLQEPRDSDLRITLYGPDPDGPGSTPAPSVVLSDRNPQDNNGNPSPFGQNYITTTFDDNALTFINAGFANPPYNGTFRPQNPLSTFLGSPIAGNWTLRVEDLAGGPYDNFGRPLQAMLNGWSITFLDANGNKYVVNQNGTFMDQDADSRTQEIGTSYDSTLPLDQQPPKLYTDAYNVPGTLGANPFDVEPFALPYDPNTLPLLEPGPHLILTSTPGQTVNVVSAVVLASSPSTINLTLDRPVDVGTFDASDVVSVKGTNGVVSGTFSVVPVNVVQGSTKQFSLVYSGTTLAAGNYTVILGSDIDVTDNLNLNSTANAIDLTFDRDIDPNSFTTANIEQVTGPIGTVSEEQTILVKGTSGTFHVSFDTGTGPQTTVELPWNVAAAGGTTPVASLQNALSALPGVGVGNVIVTETNTATGRLYQIQFAGIFNSNQPKLTANDLLVEPTSTVVSSKTHSFTTAEIGSYLTVTGGTGWTQGAYKIIGVQPVTHNGVTYNAAKLSASPAPSGTQNGSYSIPVVLNATGTAGATTIVTVEHFAVTPLGPQSADGGYRRFRVTFPTQQFPGPYSIEFGPNLALPASDPMYSVRASNIPQLVALVKSPNTLSIPVTFDHDISNFTKQDIVSVLTPWPGPGQNAVPMTAAQIADITITQINSRQFTIDFSATDFPGGLPQGQYVINFSTARSPLFVALSGSPIDTNFNAGLDDLRGTDPTASSTPQVTPIITTLQDGTSNTPEVQSIEVQASSGKFALTFQNNVFQTSTTAPIAVNATAAEVQDALNALPSIQNTGGFVSVARNGVVNDFTYVVTFGGALGTGDQNQIRASLASATLISETYTTTTPAIINPAADDGNGNLQDTITDSPIAIDDDFIIQSDTIQNITLLMNISHPNVRDLDVDLIPPSSTGVSSIRLFTGALLGATNANQTANFTNTRFLDRFGDPNVPSIETAHPPFNAGANNYFSPQNPLNVLLGKSAKGVWTLRVTNHGTNPTTSDPNFQPNAPVEIQNWSLTLPHSVPGTGLGESVSDRFEASFRIFTQDPTNTLSHDVWTPVGPAPTNETANAARVSTLAVDPSDPSGNTVYVAVAGGGVWKTSDFMNAGTQIENGGVVPSGPHYVPLTDFGVTNAINITSIALFPRNNDPQQTIIFALTGESNTQDNFAGQYSAAGVGVIRSMDGGKTWDVLDSTANVDANDATVRMSDPIRDHLFVNATGYKIVVDPTPGKDGGIILYMALAGNANQNGIWRSLDGGNHWTRIMAGNATDVVLSEGSANTNDPDTGATVFQGNLQQLYAAFFSTPLATGPGVYWTDSAPAAASLDLMLGGTDNPLIRDITIPGTPDITTNAPFNNPNIGRRISLAVPALTGNAVEDSFLRDWVYAMVTNTNPAPNVEPPTPELYVTKDAGAHWTRVRLPNVLGFGTNNEQDDVNNLNGRQQVSVGQAGGQINPGLALDNFAQGIAVDPSNPNIVYVGGTGTGSIRVDLTKMRDAHNWTFYNNSDLVVTDGLNGALSGAPSVANAANPAFTTEFVGGLANTIGGLHPQIYTGPGTPPYFAFHGEVFQGGTFDYYENQLNPLLRSPNPIGQDGGDPIDFLNLLRDYNQPFTTNSTIRVGNTGNFPQSVLAGFFVNDGADVTWSPFEDVLDPNVPDQTGDLETENRFSAVNIHAIVPLVDPLTHETRLIYGTDDGVFTGVDSKSTFGTGTLTTNIGFSAALHGNRNGNLQVSQFYSGAVQPSQLAADLAGALLYGMGDGSGFPVSSNTILTTGDLNWRGPTGDGVSVLVDQAGSGQAFEYRSPSNFGSDQNDTATSFDFFRVFSNTTTHDFSGGVSRTGGSSGSLFDNNDFWPDSTASDQPTPIPNPTVNPQNPNVLMIGSTGGRVYRTTDQGKTWVLKAQPNQLDGSAIDSVAFGASDPAKPTLTNNFLYAGSDSGNIFSTTTGGVPWTQIGSIANGLSIPDPNTPGGVTSAGPVLRIVPNPKVGTVDVFAITTNGVFYKADGTTATGNWVNITGNLFSLTRSNFGNVADPSAALKAGSLTSLAVDWRTALPFPNDPTHTFPTLYVGGIGGVFRSVDFGTNWTFFPDVADDSAPVEGGFLPNTAITDLDLSIGDLDPATGKYKPGGLNMLVATTYGRGQFAIRLDDTPAASNFVSGPRVIQLINPNPVGGPSNELDVRFSTAVDPTTFTPDDVHLVGPNGPITITGVKIISVADPATGVNPRNLFAITFPTQSSLGSYDLTVGYNPLGNNVPEISDVSGFLMNQDNDTTNGEPIVDQYRSTILLNSNTNNHLVVTSAPTSATAGTPVSVTIQAHDTNDVLINNINGTLTLSPAPGTGTFSPLTVTMSNGVATFPVTYQTAGDETINVTFSSTPPQPMNGTSWTTTVIAAAATQLVFVPSSSVVTAPANPTFTVLAEDQFGNTATKYNQTVTLTSSGAAATIPGTVDLVNGSGSFQGQFNTAGTVQLNATGPDPNNASNQLTGSASVTVQSGGATHLGYVISGLNFTTGDTANVQVTALDAQGNLATNLDGTAATIALNPGGTTTVTPTSPVFSGGVASFTVTFNAPNTYTITATAGTLSENIGPIVVNAAPPPPSPTQKLPGIFAVATSVDGSPEVDIFNGDGSPKTSFIPFPPGFNNEVDPNSGGFTGGQRVAVGDVTGDGIPDYVIGTGPSITATVVVYNGSTNQKVLTYFPFEDFKGGVFVSVGDINHDGVDEIAITPDQGGGPRVILLNGGNFTRLGSFFGINDPNFRGGARAAIGDLNGDGFGELVVSAGFQGGPRISVFDGAALAQSKFSHPIGDFFLFEPTLRNGAYVAVGDVDGDGFADIIGGAGPGGGPRVLTISGKTLLEQGPLAAIDAPVANFFGGDPNNRGGIPVAAKNVDGDRYTDILVGAGDGGGSTATLYLGKNAVAGDFTPFLEKDILPGYTGGVFVG